MAIRNIREEGDEILKKKSREVEVIDDKIRPIYFYSVDVSEFAVNKLRDRGSLEVTTIVTNIQDFLVKLKENLA